MGTSIHAFELLNRVALVLSFLFTCSGVVRATASLPSVQLDRGTFIGNQTGNVTQYLGIPYAQPPVGDLRLRLPVANNAYNGTYNATTYGPSCPQQNTTFDESVSSAIAPLAPYLAALTAGASGAQSEDCLTVDVIVPNNVTKDAKLPVVVWIYGGGFEAGGMVANDGGTIVQGSLDLGIPVVYAAMNYRLSAYGFLGGKEVKEAGVGNLGLRDQRLALRWVQNYISAFGGDPNRVIIWGQSAGAISVALQMVANGGNAEGLFHGAFMQSGSPIPVGDITDATHQDVYDSIVEGAGCANTTDTLQCLREVPFDVFNNLSENTYSIFSYHSLALAFEPRADGVFLKDHPQLSVLKGEVADIPFVSGECDDEGTMFALGNANITTDAETENYIASNFFPGVPMKELEPIFEAYPSNLSAGSPFDTGSANNLTAQFKRLAAIQGDLVFQGPRRFFLQNRSAKQDTWSYLWKRGKSTPYLGSYHSSDLSSAYGSGEIRDAVINFANNLDPNGPTLINWPRYTPSAPTLLTLLDGSVAQELTEDNYRVEGMTALTAVVLAHPL